MPITNIKTPGVYVEEVSLFPPSVAAVATAIPAFVGYTQKAVDAQGDPITEPVRITSLLEFATYFGAGYEPEIYTVVANPAERSVLQVEAGQRFYLYDSLRLFYDNGGGVCYILSVGSFEDEVSLPAIMTGIEAFKKYDEPTLLVCPDGVSLTDAGGAPDFAAIGSLHQQVVMSCAALQDRFGILDLMQGNLPENISQQPIQQFRTHVGINALPYGAAYYPWIVHSYDVAVNFRQLRLRDEADVAITDLSVFSAGDSEVALLTALETQIEDSVVVADIEGVSLSALLAEGIDVLYRTLSEMEADVRDTPAFKTRFTDYLNVVAATARRFAYAATQAAEGSPLEAELVRLKADTTLHDALQALIRVEKNAGTYLNTLALRDEPTVQELYEVLDDGWLGDGPDDTYAGITPGADFPQGREASLAIIDSLKADVLPVLFNHYRTLWHNAVFYERLAAQRLFAGHSFFKGVADQVREIMRTVPPSGAVAGVYAATDASRGVWKAPANVSLASVIGPAVKLDNREQDELNVHDSGKSINAIRNFTGKGTLIWGSRTLAGNDNEWRYIPVRRFFIMVEESVKKATAPFVFEPNDANTWIKVKVMIENFLTLQWRSGALQGAKPEQAFFVHIGLGETMSEIDVLEGRMIVEIGMAAVKPAEFILLRFAHKMMEP